MTGQSQGPSHLPAKALSPGSTMAVQPKSLLSRAARHRAPMRVASA